MNLLHLYQSYFNQLYDQRIRMKKELEWMKNGGCEDWNFFWLWRAQIQNTVTSFFVCSQNASDIEMPDAHFARYIAYVRTPRAQRRSAISSVSEWSGCWIMDSPERVPLSSPVLAPGKKPCHDWQLPVPQPCQTANSCPAASGSLGIA